ncbi:MAG TPA: hypothetical protein VM145_07680 [Sphingomicrobium sp.]|nr:hypothetical protein [Sphingomicrobium sp.]
MKTYRVYGFDSASKILNADLIEAAADDEAINIAHIAGFGPKCEIWDGERMVASLEERRLQA